MDLPFLTQCCQVMLWSGLQRKLVKLNQPGGNLTAFERALTSPQCRSAAFSPPLKLLGPDVL